MASLLTAVAAALPREFWEAKLAQARDPTKINVHVFAHTHDDVGWLKTVDQYYRGLNNSIQNAYVKEILDEVVLGLDQDPSRMYSYVEIAFFSRWWSEQTPAVKNRVRSLVQRGQLIFLNGGWCMHDEAATHYVDMIDQTTLGHTFIHDNFGPDAAPKIAWQIDPFGHSGAQASLLSAAVGFDALYYARIDYEDYGHRAGAKSLETVWVGSPSLGPNASIFAGVFDPSGYCEWPNFNYNQGSSDTPIQDNPNLEDYNVKDIVDQFVGIATRNAKLYHGDINVRMGCDFEWSGGSTYFSSIDRLMAAVNADGRVNVFYSNPLLYTLAKYNDYKGQQWPVKTDDFFPYRDGEHAVWSGYFTSRPALKRYVRTSSSLYTTARQAIVLSGPTPPAMAALEVMADGLGIAQHHDAVSGTAKQHVAFDYAKRLAKGANALAPIISHGLQVLAQAPGVAWSTCPLLNISVCATTTMRAGGPAHQLLVWNSASQARDIFVRLPVQATGVHVTTLSGQAVHSQVVDAPQSTTNYGSAPPEAGPREVGFVAAAVPPMGFAAYTLSAYTPPASEQAAKAAKAARAAAAPSLSNNVVRVDFTAQSGRGGGVAKITDIASGVATPLTLDWGWYVGYASRDGGQSSGAYIFRTAAGNDTPCGAVRCPEGADAKMPIQQGPYSVDHQVSPWIHATYRVPPGNAPYLEVEFTVGPVPAEDTYGREVVVAMRTGIQNKGRWMTDSNGRDMQLRMRDQRMSWNYTATEPIAGNFVPVTAAASISDAATQMTVLVDAAMAGASIEDGSLEFLVHRRLLHDDGRGVGEPHNETQFTTPYWGDNGNGQHFGPPLIIRGKFRIMMAPPATAASTWRVEADNMYYAEQLFLAPGATPPAVPQWSGLTAPMPPNVQVATLEPRSDGSVLVRVSHQFAIGEDAYLSNPVTVNLGEAFSQTIPFTSAVEMGLSADRPIADVNSRLNFYTDGAPAGAHRAPPPGDGVVRRVNGTASLPVTLTAMQVRTFLLTL